MEPAQTRVDGALVSSRPTTLPSRTERPGRASRRVSPADSPLAPGISTSGVGASEGPAEAGRNVIEAPTDRGLERVLDARDGSRLGDSDRLGKGSAVEQKRDSGHPV